MTYINLNECRHITMYSQTLCEKSNGGTVYKIECLKTTCEQCHRDEGVYRACPTCGEKLAVPRRQPYECVCGTQLCTCRVNGDLIVSAYIKPNDAFKLSEDVI